MHKFVLFTISAAALLQMGCSMLSQTSMHNTQTKREVASTPAPQVDRVIGGNNFCETVTTGPRENARYKYNTAYTCSHLDYPARVFHYDDRTRGSSSKFAEVGKAVSHLITSYGMVLLNCQEIGDRFLCLFHRPQR